MFLKLLALLLISFQLYSQEFIENPFLWKISKANTSSYIFGSIHLNIPLEQFPHEFKKIITNSKMIAIETNVFNTKKPFERYLKKFKNYNIEDRLSQESWIKLKNKLVTLDLPYDLNHLPPWYLTLMYLNDPSSNEDGLLDIDIYELARKSGAKPYYLESVKQHYSSIEYLYDFNHLELILNDPSQINTNKENLKWMKECYLESNLHCIGNHAHQSISQQAYEEVYANRNSSWISRIKRITSKNNGFIVVGVGHLIGKDNVLSLLEKQGYNVERVSF